MVSLHVAPFAATVGRMSCLATFSGSQVVGRPLPRQGDVALQSPDSSCKVPVTIS